MNFQHVWSVLCRKSSIDKDSNNISLIDVLERVGIGGAEEPEPESTIPFQFQLVSLWTRVDLQKSAQGEGRIIVEPPEEDPHHVRDFDIDLKEYNRLRTRNQSESLLIFGPGIYWFSVKYRGNDEEDWIEAARIPLEVNFLEDK